MWGRKRAQDGTIWKPCCLTCLSPCLRVCFSPGQTKLPCSASKGRLPDFHFMFTLLNFRGLWEVLMKTQHFWPIWPRERFFRDVYAYVCVRVCACVTARRWWRVCVNCSAQWSKQTSTTSTGTVCSTSVFLGNNLIFPSNFKATARNVYFS